MGVTGILTYPGFYISHDAIRLRIYREKLTGHHIGAGTRVWGRRRSLGLVRRNLSKRRNLDKVKESGRIDTAFSTKIESHGQK